MTTALVWRRTCSVGRGGKVFAVLACNTFVHVARLLVFTDPVVQLATNHSNRYTIGDVVDTLTDYCSSERKDPKRTYVWLCSLCINQHRVIEQKQKERSGILSSQVVDFFTEFGDQVTDIGHVLAMMTPWNGPSYLSRVWCIYELYIAHTKGTKLTIVMPPREDTCLEEDLFGRKGKGIDALYQALERVRVQNATACVESDRERILEMVRTGPGYKDFNDSVRQLLRGWVRLAISGMIKRRENDSIERGSRLSSVKFYNQVSILFQKNKEYIAAYEMGRRALSQQNDLDLYDCDEIEFTSKCHVSVGQALLCQGDFSGALTHFQQALSYQEMVLGFAHPTTAITCDNIGRVRALASMVDCEESIIEYGKELAILVALFGTDHPMILECGEKIIDLMLLCAKTDEALDQWGSSVKVLISVLGSEHPMTVDCVAKMYSMISFDALDQYDSALMILVPVLGREHPMTVDCAVKMFSKIPWGLAYTNRAITQYAFALGVLAPVLGSERLMTVEGFEKIISALIIFLPVLELGYQGVGTLKLHVDTCRLYKKGDVDGAVTKYKEALVRTEPGLAGAALDDKIDKFFHRVGDLNVAMWGRNHVETMTFYRSIRDILYRKGAVDAAELQSVELGFPKELD